MKRIYWNENWEFTEKYTSDFLKSGTLSRKGDLMSDVTGMEMQVSENEEGAVSRVVRLPHTCKEVPFHYFDEELYQMVCGYSRTFYPEKDWESEWQGKRFFLVLEGAAHIAEIFLNGEKIGEHRCGYTAFRVELTSYIKWDEENRLVVKLDTRESNNVPPFGHVIDYMTFGGLYRDVYLEIAEDSYIEDVFVASEEKKASCTIKIANAESRMRIRQELSKWKDGKIIWNTASDIENGAAMAEVRTEITPGQIAVWSIENPNLYVVKTILEKADANGAYVSIDEKEVRFGFRSAVFKTDGFYLNGEKVKLFGLNRHQSYPYVGYAMPASVQRQDALILKKELGVNAVRTSHYPQSHDFVDACDELGLFVFTEMPGWQHIGDADWKNQAIDNLREMIVEYRNHPSIILWGVRINESEDDDEFYTRTNQVAHELDDTRATGGVRANKKSHLLEDVYTYNDFVHEGNNIGCEPKKNISSDMTKPYLVSEYNGHMYPTKPFDWEEHRLSHALRHANVLEAVNQHEDIVGSFGWCMFDYNTHRDFGSGDRICYHGVMDMFRNPKMAAAVYSSQNSEQDILEVSSTFDIGEHPGCTRKDIYLFTNADSVKMYVNDVFIKEYTADNSHYTHLKHPPILVDDFIGNQLQECEGFSEGKAEKIKLILNEVARFGMSGLSMKAKMNAAWLVAFGGMKMADAIRLYTAYVGNWGGKATTYRFDAIKNGRVVKTVEKRPMTKVVLYAEADRTELVEGRTYDVACVRIKACDETGNVLPYFQGPIALEVEGEGELIGPETIVCQGGMSGTYVKTTGQAGRITLKLKTPQAEPVVLSFNVEKKG